MKKYLDVLKKCPLFSDIPDENLLRMLGCLNARVERYEKKCTVCAEGSHARNIGIVLSGSVRLIQVDYCGNRNILSTVGSSGVFAEEFACAETDYMPVGVVANEDCEIMFISCSHILHICSNNCAHHQQLIYNLMKELARKTVTFHQRIEITSKRTTREKLLTFLSIEAAKSGKCEFEISLNRQELADYLAIDRSGLSTEIGKLKKEGVIDNWKNCFRLL